MTFALVALLFATRALAYTEPAFYMRGSELMKLVTGPPPSGCISIQAATAQTGGSPAVDFVFRYVGASREEVQASTGEDIDSLSWTVVPPTEFCSNEAGIVIRRFVGASYAEWRLNRQATDPTILVESEGESGELSPTLSASVSPEALQPFIDSIPPEVLEGIQLQPELLNELTIEALGTDFDMLPQRNRCYSCYSCGGGLVGVTVAWIVGVPGACVITAGSGCFWAIAGNLGATSLVAWECLECDQCLHPPPPDPGTPGSGGCQDPSGCCESGYHECCNNQCCSDSNPPTTCN